MDAGQLTRLRAACANIYVARQNPVDADMLTRNNRLKAAAQAFVAPYSQSLAAPCCPPGRSGGPSDYGDSRLDEASFTGTAVNTFTNVMDRRAGAAICCGPPPASTPPQGIYLNTTVPGAPYIVLVEPGNEYIIVYFTGPASDGGSPIINYRYSVDNGVTFMYANTTTSPLIITGVPNGVSYEVVIQAVNAFGPGAISKSMPALTYDTLGIAQWATYLNNNVNLDINPLSVNDMVCDNNYNLYACGYINVNGGSAGVRILTYDASGTNQVLSPYFANRISFNSAGFLVRYNQTGTCQWISMVDGTDAAYSQCNRCIAVDSQQNIYSAGIISNATGPTGITTNFYDSSGFNVRQSQFSTLINNSAGYVYKMNSNGMTQWLNFFSTGVGDGVIMTTDSSNNVYYGGIYRVAGAAQIPLLDVSGVTQSNSLYSLRATDNTTRVFLIKLNSDGKTQWSTYIPSATAGGISITTDASNNIYCAISYNAAIASLADASGFQQATNAFSMPYLGLNDAHTAAALIKYNSDGKVQWCTCLTNNAAATVPYSVKIDSKGNIYLAGSYSFTLTLYDASGTGQSASAIQLARPTANNNAFMVKYNPNGKAQWAIRIDETSEKPPGFSYIDGFKNTIDGLDNIYIAGSILGLLSTPTMFNASGNTQVNSGITLSTVATGQNSAFIAKYNSNGICRWATYLDSPGKDFFYALATDRSNSVYIGGQCGTTATLQDVSGNTQTPSAIQISSLTRNAVLMKYR